MIKNKKLIDNIKLLAIKICLLLIILFITTSYFFSTTKMNGENMYPSLRDGDLLLYSKYNQTYYIGDVVVYRDKDYIRCARIIAKDNDIVDINDEGEVIVNNNIDNENIFYKTEPLQNISYPYSIKEGHYFVLGDYRPYSIDSRTHGSISYKDILGKVTSLLRIRGI